MSRFGVIPEGFRLKDLQTILEEFEEAQRAAFGADINTQADSTLGQLNGIVGDQVAEAWDVLQDVYRSRQPSSANDASLDDVAAITGALRLAQARSAVPLQLNLDDATTVTKGSLASIGDAGEQWRAKADISNALGFAATILGEFESVNFGSIVGNPTTIDTIKTPVSGWSAKAAITSLNDETYTLSDGQSLTISVDGGTGQSVSFNTGDFADIANATAAEIAAEITADTTGLSATDEGGFVRIVSDTDGPGSSIQITGGTAAEELGFTQAAFAGFNPDIAAQSRSGNTETYALTDGETITVKVDNGSTQTVTFNTADFVAIGAALAVEVARVITGDLTGAIAYVVTGGKIQIESLTAGPSSQIEVTGGLANAELGFSERPFVGTSGSASLGRLLELDPPFRVRREELLQLAGSGTVESIRSAVRNVTGVIQAFVFENTGDVVDGDGLTPHSFEAVVLGGDDTAVAQAIFDNKPAGIATHRDPGPDGRSITITDSQGIDHTIEYSRPTEIPMFVEVDVDAIQTAFGGGDQTAGEAAVADAIKAIGDTLDIGDDVKILLFQCAPLNVAGVEDVTAIKIEDTFPPTNTANIVIASRDIVTFSTANVIVNVNFV